MDSSSQDHAETPFQDASPAGTPEPPSAGETDKTPLDRVLAALEVLAVALLGSILIQFLFSLAGFYAKNIQGEVRVLFMYVILESTFTLGVMALFLRLRGRSFASLSPRRRTFGLELLLGLATLPLLFISTQLIGLFFRSFFPAYVSLKNPLLELIREKSELFLMLLASIYAGGIKEEFQRAFALRHFERYLGGMPLGLVMWSLFFGIGHKTQGLDSAVAAGVIGLVLGILYIWRGNVTAPIATHALYDVITLLTYWFFIRAA